MTPAGQSLVTNPLQLSTKVCDVVTLHARLSREVRDECLRKSNHSPSPVIFRMGSGQSHGGAQVKHALPLAMQHLPPNRKKSLVFSTVDTRGRKNKQDKKVLKIQRISTEIVP